MRKYAIVIEHGERDLPGCVTTGGTIEEIERNIREAMELHLEGLLEDGGQIPEPHAKVAYVKLSAPS